MILIVNALAVLFLFCGLDLIVEMLSREKCLSPWLCCAIVAPVKEITRIATIYGRRQQACKDTEYYYNDFSCFLTEGDTRFLHGQLFASPFNMILHCLTFIVFLTTNLSITLYSSVIIFHSFHPSFIFYQADFDFELWQMTKLITMYSVSFISGRQHTRFNNGKFLVFIFSLSILAGTRRREITEMLFEMDWKLETQYVEQKGRTSEGTRQLVSETEDFATSSESQHWKKQSFPNRFGSIWLFKASFMDSQSGKNTAPLRLSRWL